MKERQGFVSNSSASSFCLFGLQLNASESAFEKYGLQNIEKYKSSPDESVYEVIESIAYETGLGYSSDYNSNLVYLGNGPWDMDKDETRAQFEQRTKEQLRKVFTAVKDEDFNWICEPILNY